MCARKLVKEKIIKDVIETCYQGKFWDHTTNTFVRWNELS